MNHPLFALSDEAFHETLGRHDVDPDTCRVLKSCRGLEHASHDPTHDRYGVPVGDGLRQQALALWQSAIPEPSGFRWPWPTLDRAAGLLPMGDLAVVLAQTGSGKTTFTASLLNQLPETRTLVFATEIPDHRYLSALASRRAGLHPDRVQQGLWSEAGWRMTADEAQRKHQQAVKEVGQLPLLVSPHLRLKASQLRETLRKDADRLDPQLVVVDHFQAIVHDLGDGVSGVQATLEVLQDFAIDAHTTVVVTNQVHVRGQGGLPPKATDCVHLAGVFGGQALGQAASQVLGVHRVYSDFHGTIPVTRAFLQEWHKGNGKDSELWDRTKVAIDLPKIRYDAHGNVGKEVQLKYEAGQYVEP